MFRTNSSGDHFEPTVRIIKLKKGPLPQSGRPCAWTSVRINRFVPSSGVIGAFAVCFSFLFCGSLCSMSRLFAGMGKFGLFWFSFRSSLLFFSLVSPELTPGGNGGSDRCSTTGGLITSRSSFPSSFFTSTTNFFFSPEKRFRERFQISL